MSRVVYLPGEVFLSAAPRLWAELSVGVFRKATEGLFGL